MLVRVTLLLLAILLAPPSGVAHGQLRVRKNVDALGSKELENYVHAITEMKKRSATDPVGYENFVRLHNGGTLANGKNGGCIHETEGFLPWHRILLAEFEDALRKVDPPKTSNVTLPYWNFTRPASGQRFPAAFEVATTTLWHANRFNLLKKPSPPPQLVQLAASIEQDRRLLMRDEAMKALFDLPDFASFGGGDHDGQLENGPHNWMHSSYVLGDMSQDVTAARDPIFWSFHAYIDLMWYQWQRDHGGFDGTDVDPKLLPVDLDHVYDHFTKPTTVRKALDPAAFGYRYDIPPQPPPMTPFTKLQPLAKDSSAEGLTFAWPKTPQPAAQPTEAPTTATFRMEGVKVPYAGSWQADFYLHPKGEAPAYESEEFRRKYFAGYYVRWHGEHRHIETDSGRTIVVRVVSPVLEASKANPDGWVVSVNFKGLSPEVPTALATPFEDKLAKKQPTFSALSVRFE